MSKTKTLIDAEAWLEQCNPSWMYTDLAKKIIAAAPRVEVPCWVDAAKELPTEPDEYIVMIAGAEKPTVLHFDVDDEKNGVWFEEVEDSTNFYKVTHWQEMPEKPGEERTVVPMGGTNKVTRPTSSTASGPPVVASRQQPPTGEGSKKPNVCKCRSCGAEIVWVTMQSGAKMPCDAALIRCCEDKSAKTSFVTPNGIVMRGVETPDGVADFWGYRSHFESCPQAEKFRRRGKDNG